ncbi:MAG: hypothetical protein QXP27_02685, partial [Candidatus Methanomethyliaceae archaeon]
MKCPPRRRSPSMEVTRFFVDLPQRSSFVTTMASILFSCASSIALFQAGRFERAEKAGTAKGVQEFGALELAEPLDLVLLVLEGAALHLMKTQA